MTKPFSQNAFGRRTFLRGAAGTALALPWLEATSGVAFGQSTPRFPKRLVVVVHHQGTLLDRWRPGQTGRGFDLPELLEPFAPYRDRMLVLSGIDNVVRREMEGNGHNPAGRSLLTSQVFSRMVDGQGRLAGDRGVQNGAAAGPSFEHLIAQRLAGEAPHARLDFRTQREVGEYQIFWADRDLPVSGMYDPRDVERTHFGSVAAPPEPTPRDRLRSRRRAVLDTVLESYRSFRSDLGGDDRARLDRYADRVTALERTLGESRAPATCSSLDLSGIPAGYDPVEDPRFTRVTAQAMNQAIALGFACDLSRVATLQLADYHAPRFPWLGLGIPGRFNNWHAMVHEGNDASSQDLLAAGFRHYSAMVRDLLDRLDALPEGDGSVLDHTLVVWMSEFGHGGQHDTSDLPVVLFGNVEDQLDMGRHLAFSGRTTGDLFTTLLQLFGGNETTFGLERGWDGSSLVSGPLTGLTV